MLLPPKQADDGGVASLAASAAAMTVGTAHDEKPAGEEVEHPEWAAKLMEKQKAGEKLSNKERRKMKAYMESLSRDAQLAASASGAHFPFSVASLTCNMMDDKALWNSADHVNIESFTIAGTGAKGTNLFVNAQLKLFQGRRYGLVGPNGAGKSTLLRLISMGKLPLPPSLEFLLVEQEIVGDDTPAFEAVLAADKKRSKLLAEEVRLTKAMDDEDASPEDVSRMADELERIYEDQAALGVASAEARARKILAGLGFTPGMQERPTKQFSGGWRMRISLARALFIQPPLLMLDEPTNHLDLNAVLWLDNYLRGWKKCLLIVSHDADFLDNVCTDMIHLDQQQLYFYKGNYEAFKSALVQTRKDQLKAYNRQQKEIKALKKKNVKNAEGAMKKKDRVGGGAKERKRLKEQANKRAGGAKEQDNMQGQLLQKPKDYIVKIEFPPTTELSPPIIEVNEVNFNYPGGPQLFKDLEFAVAMDSRISIVGPNGVGKSTLLKLILGELNPTSGMVRRNHKCRIGRYSQHFVDDMPMDITPVQYLQQVAEQVGSSEMFSYQRIRNTLGKYNLGGHAHEIKISQCSGGQKARVVMASLSMRRPHILVLDEPTNHLDIETIEALGNGLNNFDGGVLLVSHDARLIQQCECELYICDNQSLTRYDGEFEDYRDGLLEEIERQEELQEKLAAQRAEDRKQRNLEKAKQRKQGGGGKRAAMARAAAAAAEE